VAYASSSNSKIARGLTITYICTLYIYMYVVMSQSERKNAR